MSSKKLILPAVIAAAFSLAACSKRQAPDTRTAVQKQYATQADCQKDFPVAGDCTFVTNTAGAPGMGHFMSPYFYPWGAIMHSNGMIDYGNRVPTAGYRAAPPSVQSSLASRGVNFAKAPAVSSFGGSTRGGFGSSARGYSHASFGG